MEIPKEKKNVLGCYLGLYLRPLPHVADRPTPSSGEIRISLQNVEGLALQTLTEIWTLLHQTVSTSVQRHCTH